MNRNKARMLVGLLVLICPPGTLAAGAAPESRSDALAAAACGLGVELPLVGRLIGAGPTLYTSTVDVSNYNTADTQVDFYLDGSDLTSGAAISISGSISRAGELVPVGTGGSVRSLYTAHFDDFIDSLVQAGLLPANVEPDGFLGSILFVFNGFSRAGQGGAFVRFYSALNGGTIGQALKGHNIMATEPRKLIGAFRDSRGLPSGPQLYANIFVNNTGLTPSGTLASGPVTVELQAYANSSGQPVGTAVTTSIGPGQTAVFSDVLHRLSVPAGENNVIVTVTALDGTAAIAGVAVEIDQTTRDGSVIDLSRLDF